MLIRPCDHRWLIPARVTQPYTCARCGATLPTAAQLLALVGGVLVAVATAVATLVAIVR